MPKSNEMTMWPTLVAAMFLVMAVVCALMVQPHGLSPRAHVSRARVKRASGTLDDIEECRRILKRDGVLRIENVLTDRETDSLRLRYLNFLDSHDGGVGDINDAGMHRRDIIVPIAEFRSVADAIQARIGAVFGDEAVESPKGTMIELSSLVTFPGAEPQTWHVDCSRTHLDALLPIDATRQVDLYSVAISLHDVHPDNGAFNAVSGEFDYCSESESHDVFPTNKGDVVIWNNRVCHRGGGHSGEGRGGATTRSSLVYSMLYNTRELPAECSTLSMEPY